ncbi:reverse transcriptase domain-containing protein [Ahrensia sp. 13_GOM-1096m]|uniref:reverse transcriptase domain-containing protein n=1 Tax=Ahrensia sp. 13_GOM-1096m TaxID=1380380 RepID=UPI00047C8884|nr:reverse transcriptase domain-containing protein [Ahrensia sp. 13_GOM-1096m]
MIDQQTPKQIFDSHLSKGFLIQTFENYIDSSAKAGADGQSTKAFNANLDNELTTIIRKIRLGTYEFTSYREKLISKGLGKNPRQISVPTVRDKLVLKFLSIVLSQIYPKHSALPPQSLIKNVNTTASLANANDVFVRLDIKEFYPSIDHKILIQTLRGKTHAKAAINLILKALETPTGVSRKHGALNNKGIPQGLSIANVLSSLYLEQVDADFGAEKEYSYNRFVDDILIICKASDADQIVTRITKHLETARKLTVHEIGTSGKSEIVPIAKGIDYLGYNFKKNKVSVRESSFKKMFNTLVAAFTRIKYRKGDLTRPIWSLNLKITGCIYNGRRVGWLFYFLQMDNWQQLNQLDAFVARQTELATGIKNDKRIKSFKKAYREIRFNTLESNYFPNFDNFTAEQMKAELAILKPDRFSDEYLEALSEDDLKKQFDKAISWEIRNLEKDMFEAFS